MKWVRPIYNLQLLVLSLYASIQLYPTLVRLLSPVFTGHDLALLNILMIVLAGYITLSDLYGRPSAKLLFSAMLYLPYAALITGYSLYKSIGEFVARNRFDPLMIYMLILAALPILARGVRGVYGVVYGNASIYILPAAPAIYIYHSVGVGLGRQPTARDFINYLLSASDIERLIILSAPIVLLMPFIVGWLRYRGLAKDLLPGGGFRLPVLYSVPMEFRLGDAVYFFRCSSLVWEGYARLRILDGGFDMDVYEAFTHLSRVQYVFDYDGLTYLILYRKGLVPRAIANTLGETVEYLRGRGFILEYSRPPISGYRLRRMDTLPELDTAKVGLGELLDKVFVFEYLGRGRDVESGGEYGVLGYGVYTIAGRGSCDLADAYPYHGGRAESLTSLLKTLFRFSRAIPLSDDSPVKYRVGRIRFDGVDRPRISIDIPLEKHIGVFGYTGMGKSTAMANLMLHLSRHGYRCIVFDWVGDFILLEDVDVVRPGIDVGLDLYSHMPRMDILTLYRELSILKYGERGDFTPNVEAILEELINRARDHSHLIELLREKMNRSRVDDVRSGAYAAYRRIRMLDGQIYSGIYPDVIHRLRESNILVVDLSGLGEDDKILFTVASIKTIYDYKVRGLGGFGDIYMFIDEAHRISPETGYRYEYIVERIVREGRKHGVYTVIADQAMSSIKSTLLANIPVKFIFNLGESGEARHIADNFITISEDLKPHHETFKQNIVKRILDLKPGECYLLTKYKDNPYHPIPCTFDYIEIGGVKEVDILRFREIVNRFKIPENMSQEDWMRSVENAYNLILNLGEEALKEILRYIGHKTHRIDGVKLVRDGKPTVTAQIILQYYGYTYNWITRKITPKTITN